MDGNSVGGRCRRHSEHEPMDPTNQPQHLHTDHDGNRAGFLLWEYSWTLHVRHGNDVNPWNLRPRRLHRLHVWGSNAASFHGDSVWHCLVAAALGTISTGFGARPMGLLSQS